MPCPVWLSPIAGSISMHSAMRRPQRNSGFGEKRRVAAEHRSRERAAATPRQRERILPCRDTERPSRPGRRLRARESTSALPPSRDFQQRWRNERALRRDRRRAARSSPAAYATSACVAQLADSFFHRLALRHVDHRSHVHQRVRRIARPPPSSAVAAIASISGLRLVRRNQHAANRSTLLPGLRGHLAHDFAHKESELRRIGRDIRAEQHGVQAVSLDVHANVLLANSCMLANSFARIRRTGESHYIAQPQMIEQIVRRAAQNRQRSRRKNPGINHRANHLLRQPCRRGRRLREHRNPRQQADRSLLPQSPCGES